MRAWHVLQVSSKIVEDRLRAFRAFPASSKTKRERPSASFALRDRPLTRRTAPHHVIPAQTEQKLKVEATQSAKFAMEENLGLVRAASVSHARKADIARGRTMRIQIRAWHALQVFSKIVEDRLRAFRALPASSRTKRERPSASLAQRERHLTRRTAQHHVMPARPAHTRLGTAPLHAHCAFLVDTRTRWVSDPASGASWVGL